MPLGKTLIAPAVPGIMVTTRVSVQVFKSPVGPVLDEWPPTRKLSSAPTRGRIPVTSRTGERAGRGSAGSKEKRPADRRLRGGALSRYYSGAFILRQNIFEETGTCLGRRGPESSPISSVQPQGRTRREPVPRKSSGLSRPVPTQSERRSVSRSTPEAVPPIRPCQPQPAKNAPLVLQGSTKSAVTRPAQDEGTERGRSQGSSSCARGPSTKSRNLVSLYRA